MQLVNPHATAHPTLVGTAGLRADTSEIAVFQKIFGRGKFLAAELETDAALVACLIVGRELGDAGANIL